VPCLVGAGLIALLLLGMRPAPGKAEQPLVKSLSIQSYYFSPVRGDSVTFRYVLNDTAAVYLIVLERDSSTVVDTLVAGTVQTSTAQHKAAWHGAYFDGTPAEEDTFLAVLRAETDTQTQSVYSPLFFVDETIPVVSIVLVDPALIAPGSTDPAQSPDVEITCSVSDPPPGDSLEVDVVIYGPENALVEALAEKLVPANGLFKSVWNGENADDDGLHRIDVSVRDRASNSATAEAFIDVDTEGPTITITSLENDSTLRELPDSLFGWAWDRSGVRDTVWVEFPGRGAFVLDPSSYMRSDTLFFSSVLRDSILAEGSNLVRFKARDALGQERIKGLNVTWDATAPSAPVLEELPATTHAPEVLLRGTAEGDFTDVMRIYRNDVLADTLQPKLTGEWPHLVALEPGLNRIHAVMADEAGNTSAPSNTVEITFDAASGLYIPQPFHAGDAFQVNAAKPARSVTLRVYDMSAHVVCVLLGRFSGDFVSITWDGLNGGGEKVKKGPLVAVARVQYEGGDEESLRGIFLFEP
jgi:hypothetical protein